MASHFQLATGSGKDERFSFDISHFSKNYKFELFETYSALKILGTIVFQIVFLDIELGNQNGLDLLGVDAPEEM